jgi:pimeloyl-ACP methyl ester carboxylesterase
MQPSSPDHVVRLPDGRRIAVHEYGDPNGMACVYLPGTPASGLSGAAYARAAEAAGVRLLAIDKPGYGGSDYHGGRTLLGFADDNAEVTERLGLSRFALFGESGGGPLALAVASRLPERVAVAVIAAGMGPPTESWVLDGMKPSNRRLMALARRAPWALRVPMAATRRSLLDPRRRDRLIEQQLAHAGPADRRVLEELSQQLDVTASARDALRLSGRAAAQELALLARPWGFDLASVSCRVELWHGVEDVNVPVTVAERMAALLPDAVAHVLPDEGHAIGWSRRNDIMATIAHATMRTTA